MREREREQTSTMGLFFGILQAIIILRPVFNTVINKQINNVKIWTRGMISQNTKQHNSYLPNRRAMPEPVLSEFPPSIEVTETTLFCNC